VKPTNTPKKLLGTQENLGLKAFWKLTWRLNQKKQANTKSLKRVRKHEINKRAYVRNIKIGSPNHRSTLAWRMSSFKTSYKKEMDNATKPKGTPKTLMSSKRQQKPWGGKNQGASWKGTKQHIYGVGQLNPLRSATK